jgi:hypothetical protein
MIEASSNKNYSNLIVLLRKWLDIILYISILGEIIFFFSLANLAGCLMTWIVWLIFRTFFLKREIILEHPFAFLTFLSMFLSRYIPLPATLLEGKPITYGFEVPFDTFFYETLMFLVSSLAFYAATKRKNRENNIIQKILLRLGFFEANTITIWLMGFIGIFARLQQLSVANEIEYGDVNNKFLAGLLYLQYAPIILLFPTLSRIPVSNRGKTLIWIYVSFIVLASLATNSRQAMLFPIFTIILLFFLYLLKNNESIYKFLSPIKIIVIGTIVIFGLELVSDISLAMLYTRGSRSNISRGDLFDKTLETLQSDQIMNNLRNASLEERSTINSYNEGWDERYLNNFMLNRYGNLRVSDQTLFYAKKIGYANTKMQESFFEKVLATFPLPFLNMLGININKDLSYSPGDMLSLIAGDRTFLGGFRITSLVADGLATFGYLAFLIQFVLLYLSFILIDSFVFYKKKTTLFSIFGLMNVFSFFGMYRSSIGTIVPLVYIIRGFWQQCFTFWIVTFLIHTIVNKFIRGKTTRHT